MFESFFKAVILGLVNKIMIKKNKEILKETLTTY